MVAKLVVGFFNLCIQQIVASDPALHQRQLRLDLQVKVPHMLVCLRQPVAVSSVTGSMSSLSRADDSIMYSDADA